MGSRKLKFHPYYNPMAQKGECDSQTLRQLLMVLASLVAIALGSPLSHHMRLICRTSRGQRK